MLWVAVDKAEQWYLRSCHLAAASTDGATKISTTIHRPEVERVDRCTVQPSGAGTWTVIDHDDGREWPEIVTLHTPTPCTCNYLGDVGLPCCHILALMKVITVDGLAVRSPMWDTVTYRHAFTRSTLIESDDDETVPTSTKQVCRSVAEQVVRSVVADRSDDAAWFEAALASWARDGLIYGVAHGMAGSSNTNPT
jgi:hypothetical protein